MAETVIRYYAPGEYLVKTNSAGKDINKATSVASYHQMIGHYGNKETLQRAYRAEVIDVATEQVHADIYFQGDEVKIKLLRDPRTYELKYSTSYLFGEG